MRSAVAALLLAFCAGGPALGEEPRELSGAWRGEQENARTNVPDYFRVDLTQRGESLNGRGVIDLCAGCRGWALYEIEWEGYVEGDRVVLSGAYPREYEPPVRFEGEVSADGQTIRGMLTGERVRSVFVMRRDEASVESVIQGDENSP